MSKQFEHEVANTIDRETDDETRAFRIGFSGSSAKPNPDVLLTTPRECHALEVKKASRNRRYVDGEDLEQLAECSNSYTSVWLVVKFNNREPVSIRYYADVTDDDWSDMRVSERFAALTPDCFDAHVTDDGNLRLDKPDTEEWSSARAGVADHVAILRDIGVKNEESDVL